MSKAKRRKTSRPAHNGDDAPAAQNRGVSPSTWVGRAEDFARREPVKAVASAAGAGFLLNLLPLRALLSAFISVTAFVARPALLVLGLVKAWDFCPKQKEDAEK